MDTECMSCKTTKDFDRVLERKRSSMANAVSNVRVSDVISGSSNNNFIDDDEVQQEGYSSSLFGKLAYDDLKQAHENTIIPVNNNQEIKQRNVETIRVERSQTITPFSERQSNQILSSTRQHNEQIACERAYRLHKQDEKAKKMSELFLSKFKQLTN